MARDPSSASRDSNQSDHTFDTLLEERDLEGDLELPNASEAISKGTTARQNGPIMSLPVSLEEENRMLRIQLEEVRTALEYWKERNSDSNNDTTGLWEHTMNGLRQFVSTPPIEKTRTETYDTVDMEFTRKETGLHHRKGGGNGGGGGYFERLKISPLKSFYDESNNSNNNLVTEHQDEGISLMKSHSSDNDNVSRSSIDTDDDENENDSFYHQLVDRGAWLVGLLVLQSFSSFIIQRNEILLQKHTVIVRFLTMLVGAGGNAGNQASVRVIRGLATGKVNDENLKAYMTSELRTGFILSVILGIAGCVRAAVFFTPLAETFAITTSLVMIVASSILLGTALPLAMKLVKIDPAHSSTSIQVVMDILGVAITVYISSLILDGRGGGNIEASVDGL